jgi:cytochrome P450
MSNILPSVISKTEAMINEIKAQGDQLLDIDKYFVKLTSDVICDYIFGECPQPGEVTFRSFDKPAQSLLTIKLRAILDVFGIKTETQLEIERNTRFALRAIQKVKLGQSKCSNGSPTLCERLLQYKEYQGPEGEARLSQELLVMVFAGHDTTAHSLTILSYVLSQEPECLNRIRQEVERLVPTTADLTAAKLSKLEYTSAAIKESLRLHPILDILLIQSYKDNMIDNLPVPEGTSL